MSNREAQAGPPAGQNSDGPNAGVWPAQEVRLTIHELAEQGIIPTSMIDISDGLASEILHLSKQSGNGFTVFFENIPIENMTLETTTELNISPIVAVINGGEDYELLMTIKQSDFEKIKGMPDITPIGFVNNEKQNWLVLNSGERTQITAPGWK